MEGARAAVATELVALGSRTAKINAAIEDAKHRMEECDAIMRNIKREFASLLGSNTDMLAAGHTFGAGTATPGASGNPITFDDGDLDSLRRGGTRQRHRITRLGDDDDSGDDDDEEEEEEDEDEDEGPAAAAAAEAAAAADAAADEEAEAIMEGPSLGARR